MVEASTMREQQDMRIGSSIGLIALGLILALAVNIPIHGVDLHQIGWILAVVGVIGLIISVVLMRRTRPVVERDVYPPAVRDESYPVAEPRRGPDPRY